MLLLARAPHRTPPFLDDLRLVACLITHNLRCEKFPQQLTKLTTSKFSGAAGKRPCDCPRTLGTPARTKPLASV